MLYAMRLPYKEKENTPLILMHIISLFYLNMTWWIMFLFLVLCLLVWGCGNQSITTLCWVFVFLNEMTCCWTGQFRFISFLLNGRCMYVHTYFLKETRLREICMSSVIRGFIVSRADDVLTMLRSFRCLFRIIASKYN